MLKFDVSSQRQRVIVICLASNSGAESEEASCVVDSFLIDVISKGKITEALHHLLIMEQVSLPSKINKPLILNIDGSIMDNLE